MEKSVSWQQIKAGDLVDVDSSGTIYKVAELGTVWIAPHIAQRLATDPPEKVCLKRVSDAGRGVHQFWIVMGVD